MAKRKDIITLHHPVTGGEMTAVDEKQAGVFLRRGWKKGEAPKSKKGDS